MSIAQFLGASLGAWLFAGVFGAVLEIVIVVPAYSLLLRKHEQEMLGVLNDMRAMNGLPRSAALAMQVAPGRGHLAWLLVSIKNAMPFAATGFAMGWLVSRFLTNEDRMDLLWYIVGATFITPWGVRDLRGNAGFWLLGLCVYAASLIVRG